MAYMDYPFQFDGRGRAATVDKDGYIRDLIRQVLFTNPGERVNRPDFGCGIQRLVFTPNSEALATATRFQVHTALQRWLAEIIQVHDVQVVSLEGELTITVIYTRLDLAERNRDLLTVNVGGP